MVDFDTSEWSNSVSHKGSPRGFGSWCFSIERDQLFWGFKDETRSMHDFGGSLTYSKAGGYIWVNQATYSQAKKVASKIAGQHGWSKLYIQP